MMLLDFQLRMLRLAGEMMGAAAAALTPAPSASETAAPSMAPSSPSADDERVTPALSPLLAFPRLASGVSKALSDVQPAPQHEAPVVPFAAFFPFAAWPLMGATAPPSSPFAWASPRGHAHPAMAWPGVFGAPVSVWTAPWAGLFAWMRFAPQPFPAAGSGFAPFLMMPWAMPALRAWTDLASAAAPAPSTYRSASGYAVAQVVARSLLLAAGSLMTMAMALESGFLA